MKKAKQLLKHIEAIKGKLRAEGIDLQDYDKAIECLEKVVCPDYCIRIYEEYINY